MKKSIIVLCTIVTVIFRFGLVTPLTNTQDWSPVGRPAPGHEVRLTFAVKQHNPGWLKDKIKAVSYPDSPEYTNYMNFDEIANYAYVYGEPESVQVVTKTLESMRVQKMDFTLGKDFVVAHVPYEAAEKVFQAYFLEFKHRDIPGLRIVSSRYYMVPPYLKEHVDFVSGLVLFPTYSLNPVIKELIDEKQILGVTPKTIAKDYVTRPCGKACRSKVHQRMIILEE